MQSVENTYSFITIFPEEVSSRESWLLLVFSHHDVLTVGFGFADVPFAIEQARSV